MLKTAFDFIDEGILITDEELRVQFINKAFERLFSLNREEVSGAPVYEIFPDIPEREKMLERTKRQASGQKAPEFTFPWNGRNYVLQAETEVGKTEDGTFFIAKVTDLTDHVQEQERLMKAVDDLSSKVILLHDDIGILPLYPFLTEDQGERTIHHAMKQCTEEQLSMLIVDLSAIKDLEDTYVNMLTRLLQMLSLLGLDVKISGVQPEAAAGMVDYKHIFRCYPTYSHLKTALRALDFQHAENRESAGVRR
ncbi:PAS domain S-box protein [Alkalicoccus urumqiensis]|nr:PAS domain S-box protein [Alkalicoccus urumqiensis]